MLVDQISSKLTQTLDYLQNDDGGWGELKTQATRVTNTCEALWALSFVNVQEVDVESALEIVKNGIVKGPSTEFEHCEIARDFGWALLALNAWSKLDIDLARKAVKVVSTLQNNSDGGFYGRSSHRSTLFDTGITLLGLNAAIKSLQKHTNKADAQTLIDRAVEIADKALDFGEQELLLTTQVRDCHSDSAYMLYALSVHRPGSISLDHFEAIAQHVISNYPDGSEADYSSRHDNRPYRHFSSAWFTLAASEIGAHQSVCIPACLENFRQDRGWRLAGFDGEGCTWVNALGAVAALAIAKRTDVLKLLKANTKQKSTGNARDDRTNRKIFIIHGHGIDEMRELQKFLKNLDYEPVVAIDEPNNGIEFLLGKVKRLAGECRGAIALFTADDQVAAKSGGTYTQGRPNVFFELGYFLALDASKLMIVAEKSTTSSSELSGIVTHEFEASINEVFIPLIQDLKINFPIVV